MSKKRINSTLAVFVASVCLFSLIPSLALASENGGNSRPSAGHPTPQSIAPETSAPKVTVVFAPGATQSTTNGNGVTTISGITKIIVTTSKSPEPKPTCTPEPNPTRTPEPKSTRTPDPKPTLSQLPPSFTPITRSDPCVTTQMLSPSVTHTLSLFNLATLDTTHCKKMPEIPKKEPSFTFTVKSKTYFNVNGSKIAYINEPSANYFAPDGTTNGKPTPEVGVPPTGCLNSTMSDFNNRVQLQSYGVHYTDVITNQTTTTTYATGPQTSTTATTARSTAYSGCVYPDVKVFRSCVVSVNDFRYSGATGNNVDNQIIIPTGPAQSPAGISQTITASWIPQNANVIGPGDTFGNQTTETVSNPATWLYQPATPVPTKLGFWAAAVARH